MRELFINELRLRIGKPYIWGSNGPDSYDCSGLICACLNNSGYKIGDITASGLADHFYKYKVVKNSALPGTLFFYGDSVHIHHVMAVLDRWKNGNLILVGARGGDQTTTNVEEATLKQAMVDIVDGNYWNSRFQYALDPFRK